MAQVLVNETSLEDIADAIRDKNGGSTTYQPAQMAAAIRSISTGVTGVKGNAESSYRSGDVNLTPANIGAKATQSTVSSPSASGTAVAFIDTISQNAQGVITATKKTVRNATTSLSGLMSASDKSALDGLVAAAIATRTDGVNKTISAKGTTYVTVSKSGYIPIGARLELTVQGTPMSLALVVSSPYGDGNGMWYIPIYNNSSEAYTVTGTLVSYWIKT